MFTKSVYDHLTLCPGGAQFSHNWKANIPYKIKIFTWLVENGAVLTKDSMVKRKWLGDPTCVFCDQLETVDHLFFLCPVVKCVWGMIGSCFGAFNTPINCDQYKQWIARWLPGGQIVHHFGFTAICWATWKCRNKAAFDRKIIQHPAKILIQAYAFMTYWAGLHSSEFHGKLLDGVKSLLACAHRSLAQQTRVAPRMLPAPPEEEEQEE